MPYSQGIGTFTALQRRGIDSRRVFAAAGIGDALKNDPLMRLPVATIARMYRAAVEATGDPYFGLQVANLMGPACRSRIDPPKAGLPADGFGLECTAEHEGAQSRRRRVPPPRLAVPESG